MPVLNDNRHDLDLDTLMFIHGYEQDPEWATEGMALDLDLSVIETRQLLRAHGVDVDTKQQPRGTE